MPWNLAQDFSTMHHVLTAQTALGQQSEWGVVLI